TVSPLSPLLSSFPFFFSFFLSDHKGRRRRSDSFSPSVTATAAEGRPPPLYSSSDYDDLRRKTLAGARLRRGRVKDELRVRTKSRFDIKTLLKISFLFLISVT
ncbi:hypothetical protein LINGRAHAP2_LOCUS31864, partial [Linum grandiflorum]